MSIRNLVHTILNRKLSIGGVHLLSKQISTSPVALHLATPTTTTTLDATIDRYNGVEITDSCITSATTPSDFQTRLHTSLDVWRKEGRVGVWLKIPTNASQLISAAIAEGFTPHHCDHSYFMFTAWLPPGPSRLPPQPHSYIGVAGFVMNTQRQVLMVKERSGPAAALALWKMPGGLVDRHEDIPVAVVREVREEVGLDSEFLAVSSVQEMHHGAAGGFVRAGRTDMFFVCVLRPRDEHQPLTPCSKEISAAMWMPIDEVASDPQNAGGLHNRALALGFRRGVVSFLGPRL